MSRLYWVVTSIGRSRQRLSGRGLFQVAAYAGQVGLHGGGVAGDDNLAQFGELLLYAGELFRGVGVEENLRQQVVVLRHQSAGDGHVALECCAGSVLMAHYAGKHER